MALDRLRDYTKQSEGVKAFKEAGIPYPDSLFDELFDKWLTESVNKYTLEIERDEEGAFDKAVKESPFNKKENYAVTSMTRVLISGKEYLVYSDRVTRYDSLGNRKNWHRSHLGRYPKPIVNYKKVVNPDTGKSKKVIDYVITEPAFSIPFTAKAADDLHKFAIENATNENENTKYMSVKGDLAISGVHPAMVYTYKDFRDGSFEDLQRWGRIASSLQKQIMEDEKAGKYYAPNAAQTRAYT